MPCIASQAQGSELIGRLTIAGIGRQTEQTPTLVARPQALAAKQQNMPIEALRLAIPQISHTGELPFHPAPGPRLLDQPRPVEQTARQQVTDARAQRTKHQASSG